MGSFSKIALLAFLVAVACASEDDGAPYVGITAGQPGHTGSQTGGNGGSGETPVDAANAFDTGAITDSFSVDVDEEKNDVRGPDDAGVTVADATMNDSDASHGMAGQGGGLPPTGGTGGMAGVGGMIGSGGMAGNGGIAGNEGMAGMGGTMASGGNGGAGGTPDSDPCAGIPSGGVCLTEDTLRFCFAPTDQSDALIFDVPCKDYEHCVYGDVGVSCEPHPSACMPGTSRCTGDDLEVCENETWTAYACTHGCETSGLGAFCVDAGGTSLYTGTIRYMVRTPQSDYSDWGQPFPVGAQGLLIASYRNGNLVNTAISDADGTFTVEIPVPIQPDDRILAWAVRLKPNGNVAYALAVPNVSDGEHEITAAPGENAQFWVWSIDPNVTASGSTVTISEASGSGAMRVFDYLRYTYAFAQAQYGETSNTPVVWLRYNSSWTCGACFWPVPTQVKTTKFDSQFFIPATIQNQAYYSDPVTVHEIGHWVMRVWGRSPNEGGRHCIGVPTFPGQAWSEGWATGFSSIVRGNHVFYDKQYASMFWVDISSRMNYGALPWQRPSPDLGILQRTDENEVAAMLYELSLSAIGKDSVLQALRAPEAVTSPFLRGYKRHQWEVPEGKCMATNIQQTQQSTPMFADYLDGLVCSGADTAIVNAVTQPMMYYPYNANEPLCK